MIQPIADGRSFDLQRPNIYILHCGLDIKRLEKSCEKQGIMVSSRAFRKEEVFAYYVRLDRPRPDLIISRNHFLSLVQNLNRTKGIPTVIVSTHKQPVDCFYPFVRATHGYDGPDALQVYEQLAVAVRGELRMG
ncbi:MAG: hypothetical protein JSU72_08820 [Deltaproteobacteria bacterium]|nr:MAG: hypothetical protein JSU72_08820 [Deltaproteobacteria bacterium]